MEATTLDRKPPYGGFRTFWNFIAQLHEHQPLPQLLDRSIMGNRGGSARSELYTALRFFGLMDERKAPTDKLHQLAAEPTTDKLGELMRESYAPVIALKLDTATPRQVDDALAGIGATPATTARARAFFLHGAEEAGIGVGRTLKAARGKSTGPRTRTRKARSTRRTENELEGNQNRNGDSHLPPLVAALVGELPAKGQEWDEDDAREWLALIVRAVARGYKLDLSKLKEP
jgi:hypothetical protein